MADTTVHPESGADEEATKIWNDLAAADAAKAEPADAATDPAPEKVAEPEKKADAPADTSATTQPADGKGTATAAPAPVDIWANATPEQRAAYEATRKDLDTTNGLYRRYANMVPALQRTIATLEKGTAQGVSTVERREEAKAAAAKASSLLDDPDLKKAAEDYPEVFGPLNKVVSALEKRAEKAERELNGITQQNRTQALHEQRAYVQQQHPDFNAIAGSAKFRAWYEKQPKYVKDVVERNASDIVDGLEVTDVVRKFKAETGTAIPQTRPAQTPASPQPPAANPKRALQQQSALTPRTTGPAKAASGPPDAEDGEAYWNYLAEQDARKKERARNR